MKGQHWIAAGIQFIAFGFIYGKVVVAIGFGNKFSMQILGMAAFGIEPICYFEIGIEVTADEEKFIMRARLSPNSYVIHPDIFSLQGDFALCAWYAEPHKGDFLFSIGGYHPLFAKPEHYPELIRVGCKATVYNFVHLSVEVFFCCTPQALMAGAKASLWAEFAGIEAGLDVYVDVLMKWDPFFLRARLGVHVWFVFFGRHEIGVDLEIWTPKFGGMATIDLALVEFDIEFGAEPRRAASAAAVRVHREAAGRSGQSVERRCADVGFQYRGRRRAVPHRVPHRAFGQGAAGQGREAGRARSGQPGPAGARVELPGADSTAARQAQSGRSAATVDLRRDRHSAVYRQAERQLARSPVDLHGQCASNRTDHAELARRLFPCRQLRRSGP